MKTLLTIFTPTYNRAHLLGRLYHSLLSQNDMEFEWILVDDGSSDRTEEWVNSLPPTPFLFKYIKTTNKGKHIAINIGAQAASGKWFFIVDSDDYLKPSAVSTLKELITQTPQSTNYAGFCTNREYEDGRLNGPKLDYDVLDSDFISYSIQYGYNGEKPQCLKTEVWRSFPFPEYSGEKFCSEALILRRIAKKLKVRYFNKCVYIMEGYLEDGLTQHIKFHFRQSPTYAAMLFKEQLSIPEKSFRFKISTIYNYWYYYLRGQKKYSEIKPNIKLQIAYPIYLLFSCIFKILHKN